MNVCELNETLSIIQFSVFTNTVNYILIFVINAIRVEKIAGT